MADLVFPEEAAERLRIPPLDLYIGTTDIEWVALPYSTWTLRRRPVLRLPLIPFIARNARFWVRIAPVVLIVNLLLVPAAVLSSFLDGLPFLGLGSLGAFGLQFAAYVVLSFSYMLLYQHWRPSMHPERVRGNQIMLLDVADRAAEQWVALNPGVVRTIQQPIPTFQPRVYASGAIPLVVLGIALIVTVLVDQRATLPSLVIALSLIAAGAALAFLAVKSRSDDAAE